MLQFAYRCWSLYKAADLSLGSSKSVWWPRARKENGSTRCVKLSDYKTAKPVHPRMNKLSVLGHAALVFLLSLSCFPISLPQSRRFFRWIGRQHLPCCYLPTQKESLSEVKWCTSLYKHLAPWGERRSIGEKKCSLHPQCSLSFFGVVLHRLATRGDTTPTCD